MSSLQSTAREPVAAESLREHPALGITAFLMVEVVIGYEWLISGLNKFVQGDFAGGLGRELGEKLGSAPAWYGAFLERVAIPHARFLGYAVQTGELLAGLVMVVGPLLWLVAWHRLSDLVRATMLAFTAAAAFGGALLALNLHFASGATHPWLVPGAAFDEGVESTWTSFSWQSSHSWRSSTSSCFAEYVASGRVAGRRRRAP